MRAAPIDPLGWRHGPGVQLPLITTTYLAYTSGLLTGFGGFAWIAVVIGLSVAIIARARGKQTWLACAVIYAAAAVIAVSVGTLVRHTAGAVSLVLVWSLMAEQLLQIIPGVGTTVGPWLPFSAAKEFLAADGSADGLLGAGPWGSIAYFALVAAGLLTVSIAVARRRDA